MKSILAIIGALLLLGACADCPAIAADTNKSGSPWQWGSPHAAPGYMLVRLETVEIRRGYESGGWSVSATVQPIEFKYPEDGRALGGGADPAHNPFRIKPAEINIGKSFSIWIFTGSSIPQPQRSIVNLLEACADENDPKRLKLNLIFSIPIAEAADWKGNTITAIGLSNRSTS